MEKQPEHTEQSEWADLPLFRETNTETEQDLEKLSDDELTRAYIRLIEQNPKYFTNGTREALLFALRNPEAEIARIARQIAEENEEERSRAHHS